jgi:hypothetical protein
VSFEEHFILLNFEISLLATATAAAATTTTTTATITTKDQCLVK